MMILTYKEPCLKNETLNGLKNNLFYCKPTDVIKFLVFSVCFVVVFIQLRECWHKVNYPPIITHTRLSLNESISYPALTICREPPYNKRYYEKFHFNGLHLGSYPMTSQWNDFPYDEYNISEFWDIAVYNQSVLTCCSLSDLLPSDIAIESSIYLTTGMCHTVRPNKAVEAVQKKPGYHILLLHDLYRYDPFRDREAGWYIYVHETKEKFSENINIYSGRQACIFVPVGEKVDVSLEVYEFISVQNCSSDPTYSQADCEENCWIKEDITPKVNCSGPWLPALKKPYCNEANGMIDLVKATLLMNGTDCCKKSCRTAQYKTNVIKRTPYPQLRKFTSGANIYFASKAIVTVEEKYSYDWNVFIADFGGSVGFLLGLSVIGLIGYLERIFAFIISLYKRKPKIDKEKKDSCSISIISYNYK